MLFSRALIEECVFLFHLSWPIQITQLLDLGLQIVTLAAAGHLSEISLGSASLGNLYLAVFSLAPLVGLAGALDTLSSQAAGARNYSRIGELTLCAIVILSVLVVPFCFFLYYSPA